MNQIFTSRYASPEARELISKREALAVGITLYPPRYQLPFPMIHRLTSLAPNHRLFKVDDYEAFHQPFLELLESRWLHIQFELEDLSLSYLGLPLVLLCFDRLDRPGDWCHRQIVAEFLSEKTGQEVTEL